MAIASTGDRRAGHLRLLTVFPAKTPRPVYTSGCAEAGQLKAQDES
jgi:hypothetical protein